MTKKSTVIDWGEEEEGDEVEGNVIIKLFFLQAEIVRCFYLICFSLVFYFFAVDNVERDQT